MSIAGFMYSSLFCSASNSDNGILDNDGVLRNLNTSFVCTVNFMFSSEIHEFIDYTMFYKYTYGRCRTGFR